MATWEQFESSAPRVAATGWSLLSHPGFGFGYLATVRSDGAPRLHPTNPDLRRAGRHALHSSGAENVNDEFCVSGRARIVEDEELRAAALPACHFTPGDAHVLVDLGIDSALWAHCSTPPSWPPVCTRWAAD